MSFGTEADGYRGRRSTYRAGALWFAAFPLPSYGSALRALRTWLDSWAGIGHVAVRIHRQGFYTTGMAHSPTSVTGSAWEPTPWRAVQGAACDVLRRARG